MKPNGIEVIVSTYNRPDALEATLRSLLDQDCSGFRVTVADDGSTDATRDFVERLADSARIPIRHVHHEDRGFRLSEIRNLAVAEGEAPYLIFMDGDCVVRRDFVRSHARLAEPGFFLRGSRVLMNERLTRRVLTGGGDCHRWSRVRWFGEYVKRGIDRVSPLFSIPQGPLRKLATRKWDGVKTCNVGVWRDDFIAVNGFDEDFVGWGLEDNDLALRLIRAGTLRKDGRYSVPVLHLWHPRADETIGNARTFAARLASDQTRAERGVDRHIGRHG